MNKQIFAKRLKEVRKSNGYSTEWIANKSGISEEQYKSIEAGDIDNLDIETVMQISFVLDISLDYLTGLKDEITPSVLCDSLNKYDLSDERDIMTRDILHKMMLLNDKDRETMTAIIKIIANK